VPIDARLQTEADLDFESVNLELVIKQLERTSPRVALIFLDACRDNPLASNLIRTGEAKRSMQIGRGFARVDVHVGSLIAYSTAPDETASDSVSNDRHSPFTSALLKHIKTPGLEIRQLLTRVRAEVVQVTDGLQVPWDHSSLLQDFYFIPDRIPMPDTVSKPAPKLQLHSLPKSDSSSPVLNEILAKYSHITGPSFKCTGSLNSIESILCSDPGLRHIDGILGKVYGSLRSQLSENEYRKLRTAQRNWIKQRNQICVTSQNTLRTFDRQNAIDCLQPEIERRVIELYTLMNRFSQ
jgi:uncharacterized protein YecT (DUF1311 family)